MLDGQTNTKDQGLEAANSIDKAAVELEEHV
jgi:hypothetical protein